MKNVLMMPIISSQQLTWRSHKKLLKMKPYKIGLNIYSIKQDLNHSYDVLQSVI